MNRTSITDIAKATEGQLIKTCGSDTVSGVVHDSRECGSDDLFVCVIGENRDGHDYLEQVIEAGCRNLLVSNADRIKEHYQVNAVLVEDTVEAMGKLASWYLDQLNIMRIAVTGSVGKTSTRDMIYYVLNEKFRCGRNLKNYNNHIGLPLSIFRLDDEDDAVVLEMGMSDFGEISYLSGIVRPQIGVITGIGTSHMEYLGSREGIFRAKMEITDHLAGKSDGGTMIFAYDEEFLNPERACGDYESIFTGGSEKSDYIVTDVEDRGIDGVSFSIVHGGRKREFSVPVPGRHNAFNGALAVAVGDRLGLSDEQIGNGLGKVRLTGHRLRIIRENGLTIIDDTYNASPDSMKAGLKVLQMSRTGGRKTAILGEMYELGKEEKDLHRMVGVYAAECGIDRLVGIGPLAENITEGASSKGVETFWFEDVDGFLREKDRLAGSGDLVLVKASRGMELERVVRAYTE